MHSGAAERGVWIADRFENPPAAKPGRERILAPQYILERLIRAELFEQTLQARFVGTKRYSLEGLAALIPLLDQIVETGAASGAEQMVLAMSHRGRLNVIVHIVGRPPAATFTDFESLDPPSVLAAGAAKYHSAPTAH